MLLTTVAVVALAHPAKAAPDLATRQARALFDKAEVHFSLGQFQPALGLYQRAYTAKPLAGFLFNIGLCHHNLGQHKKALFFYQRYLVLAPEAPNRGEVEKLIKVATREASARVTPATRPQPASQPSPVSDPGAASPAEGTKAPVSGASRQQAVILWTGVGLTSALLITGTITGALALQQSDEYNDSRTRLARRQELRDSGPALTTVSTVTFAVGAAAAVGTALYYWFGYRRPAPQGVTLAPVGQSGAMITFGGKF